MDCYGIAIRKMVKTGQYKHLKGGQYDVLGTAKHSETLEDLVIYETLYNNKTSNLWARPIDSFTGTKELDNQKLKRFEYLGPVKRARIEVHVGTICFQDNKCLVLKRSKERELYPGLWECGGGKVRPGETFEDAAQRQMKEEAGIKIDVVEILGTYAIPIPEREQKVIPGLKFLCQIKPNQNIKISDEHEEWKLIGPEEINDINFIPGVDDDVRDAFEKVAK